MKEIPCCTEDTTTNMSILENTPGPAMQDRIKSSEELKVDADACAKL